MTSKYQSKTLSNPRRRFLQGAGAGAAAALVRPGTVESQIEIEKELKGGPILPERLTNLEAMTARPCIRLGEAEGLGPGTTRNDVVERSEREGRYPRSTRRFATPSLRRRAVFMAIGVADYPRSA